MVVRERHGVCIVGSGRRFLSGISYYTCRLANALAEEHDTSVLLMRRLLPARLYPGRARVGADLTELGYRPDVPVYEGVDWYWGRTIWRGLRFVVRQRPEAVLFEWWTGTVLHTYLVLALTARALGARVYVEFHETLDTAESRLPLARAYASLGIRPLLGLAAGFVVHSSVDREELARRYRLGGRPVAVVPHGPYDHGVGATPCRGHGVGATPCRGPADPFNLLFFGTIRPYKGLEHLVEAFNELSAEEAGRFRLTVVGETWEGWTRPAELIARSPHRDRITFVNRYVSDREAARFFGDADAVVLPYLRSSASGPAHMAMSHGLPLVITPVGGLAESTGDYDGTRFVPPRDPSALRSTLLELERAPRRRYADRRSWSVTVEHLTRLFAIGEGGSPAREVPAPAAQEVA